MGDDTPRPRLDHIDALRGLVMALMALDHTRDFVGDLSVPATDVNRTTAALFLTRVVTHLCAPTFVFLAGAGASLWEGRGRSKWELTQFLLGRGLFLVLLEVTVVRLFWTGYDVTYKFTALQVIWAIGAAMVLLAGLAWLPRWAVAVIGAHNYFDLPAGQRGDVDWWRRLLHAGGPIHLLEPQGPREPVLMAYAAYPVMPWFGVMALGYALGPAFRSTASQRRWLFAGLGVAFVLAFLAVRGLNGYGDPAPWKTPAEPDRTWMAFVNCEKYPPSLDYCLMTLGPAFLLLAALDGPVTTWLGPLVNIGRAPLFFYLLHLPVIHLATLRTNGQNLSG